MTLIVYKSLRNGCGSILDAPDETAAIEKAAAQPSCGPALLVTQDPKRTVAPNIGQRASRRTMAAAITEIIVGVWPLIGNSQPHRKVESDFFVRDYWPRA